MQARIILGIVAAVIVAAGLTIWLLLAIGHGTIATLAPLVMALVAIVVSRSLLRAGGRRGPPD